MHYVIIPGINGSGPDHWQTVWQQRWGGAATRIAPASWDAPELQDWLRAIDRAVDGCVPADRAAADGAAADRAAADRASADIVLVAHSLGCLAAAAWLGARRPDRVRGAFLVAPPDATAPAFPAEAAGFTGVATVPLPIPALVVTSEDDPYCAPEAARRLVGQWRAGHVGVGAAGHVNGASGLGAWPFGQGLLAGFVAGIPAA
jgi:predicted alpha/beta hydrolase family esterase